MRGYLIHVVGEKYFNKLSTPATMCCFLQNTCRDGASSVVVVSSFRILTLSICPYKVAGKSIMVDINKI
jgi:hypothetical protein